MLLTHVAPSETFGIGFECFEEPTICKEFDFNDEDAVPITSENVEERAEIFASFFVDQFSSSFKHNLFLLPLRLSHSALGTKEGTENTFESFQTLFDHINQTPELKIKIRFATLSEFFTELHGRVESGLVLPVVSRSDDFSLNENDPELQSRLFYSLPSVRQMIQSTSSIIRSTQHLFSLALSQLFVAFFISFSLSFFVDRI